ncbi:MAG: CRTAC1 family protein [Acidobacteriota bacterium]
MSAAPRIGASLCALLVLFVGACGPPPDAARAPDVPASAAATTAAAGDASDDPRTPGTRRMAARLDALQRNAAVMANPFLNDQRLALMQAMPLPDDPVARTRAEIELAEEFLRAGDSAEAARRFAAQLAIVEADPSAHPSGLARRVRTQLAVAYLRLGEQQNCIDGHSAEACLMPIRGGGVHRIEDGSRRALAELDGLLRAEPDDLMNRWLYNLASMTLGEHPEGVPEAWRIPLATFASEGEAPRFVDRAPDVGLDTIGLAGGVVFDDFDGDDRPDALVSSWALGDPLRYYRNVADDRGHLAFAEQTAAAGLAGITGGLNLVHGDVDNDGHLDALVLRGAWRRDQGRLPNSLLLGDGRGGFDDVTEAAGLLSFHPTQVGVFADFDNDGWLDLFIGNESARGDRHPCELFLNRGVDDDGVPRFENVAVAAGAALRGAVKGAAAGDIDNDGWVDLFVTRMNGPNVLLRNRGPGPDGLPRFDDITAAAGVAAPTAAFAAFVFDVDTDGWLDLFAAGYANDFVGARAAAVVVDYLGKPFGEGAGRLYRNRGDGRFDDVTAAWGIDHAMLVMGANVGDVDGDGWLDLYLGTGAPDYRALVPNRLFRNDAGRAFLDVTTAAGVGHLQKGHGVAFADVDSDGDQDILAVMGGAFSGDVYPNALFVNPGAGHRFLTVRLIGQRANRAAIGARVQIDVDAPSGARSLHRVIGGGGSFGASSLRRPIGLGDARAVRALTIRWPGGGEQTLTDLPLDRELVIVEGEPSARIVDLAPAALPAIGSGAGGHRAHHHPAP